MILDVTKVRNGEKFIVTSSEPRPSTLRRVQLGGRGKAILSSTSEDEGILRIDQDNEIYLSEKYSWSGDTRKSLSSSMDMRRCACAREARFLSGSILSCRTEDEPDQIKLSSTGNFRLFTWYLFFAHSPHRAV